MKQNVEAHGHGPWRPTSRPSGTASRPNVGAFIHPGKKQGWYFAGGEKGFTLVEIVVGLFILGMGLLAVIAMQLASIRGNFFSGSLTQASILSQDRLEELRTLPSTHPDLSPGDHPAEAVQIAGTTFVRDYRVTSTGGMLNITLTVRWNDGSDHSVSFSTVRTISAH